MESNISNIPRKQAVYVNSVITPFSETLSSAHYYKSWAWLAASNERYGKMASCMQLFTRHLSHFNVSIKAQIALQPTWLKWECWQVAGCRGGGGGRAFSGKVGR